MRLKILLDMDEVLFDLSGYILERVNSDFGCNFPVGFNKSYWWKDYGIEDKAYFERVLNEKGTFLKLKPNQGVIEVMNYLHEEGFDIHVLTLPQYNQTCFYEKVLSVKKHLPWLNVETNFHTSGSKYLLANENTILIDDNLCNIESFVLHGGKGIVVAHGWNETFNELSGMPRVAIKDFEEVKYIIKEMERELNE